MHLVDGGVSRIAPVEIQRTEGCTSAYAWSGWCWEDQYISFLNILSLLLDEK